jgi:hypothetical protein
MVRSFGKIPGSTANTPSIAGGFVRVDVASLMAAWRACRSRPLGVGDLRAWFAAQEMLARRCGLDEGRVAAFGHAELAGLLGVQERTARASLRRLGAAGLMTWSEAAIVFPPPSPIPMGGPIDDTIGGGKGSVAIPRRLLRLLVAGARPAMIATALGALLRCLSRRRSGWSARGRFKASWVAQAFQVSLRQVRAARLHLVALGWLVPEDDDQRAMNRWGKAWTINLTWEAPRSAPPYPADRRENRTPSVNPDPLPGGRKDQEPRGAIGTGVGLEGSGPGDRPLPAPRLDDIRPEDLGNIGRALALFDQSAGRGLIGRSEADRLRFLALAEHCRSYPARSPGGLFSALLRRGAWQFATHAEEDRAQRRLREHLHGPAQPEAGLVGARPTRANTFVPDTPAVLPLSLGGVLDRIAGHAGWAPMPHVVRADSPGRPAARDPGGSSRPGASPEAGSPRRPGDT